MGLIVSGIIYTALGIYLNESGLVWVESVKAWFTKLRNRLAGRRTQNRGRFETEDVIEVHLDDQFSRQAGYIPLVELNNDSGVTDSEVSAKRYNERMAGLMERFGLYDTHDYILLAEKVKKSYVSQFFEI